MLISEQVNVSACKNTFFSGYIETENLHFDKKDCNNPLVELNFLMFACVRTKLQQLYWYMN